MGQKLEKLSEKDKESFHNSDWSEQTALTEQSEIAVQDESRGQDNGSFGQISGMSVSVLTTGHRGELTLTRPCSDAQTGQPIRPRGRQQQPLNTRAEWVGGDKESWRVVQTAEESEKALCPKDSRQTSNKKRGSQRKAVAYSGTAAMEEQNNGKKLKLGPSKSEPDAQTRSLTDAFDPTNEEDFVVLEKDEIWMSSEGGNNAMFGTREDTDNPQSSLKRGLEVSSLSYNDHSVPRASRNSPQETGIEKTNRRKSDTHSATSDGVEARARSLPTACFEREMGQHLAEVTGSRCRLKGVSYAGAETTGKGKAERKQRMNEHNKQVSTNIDHLSTRNNSGSVTRVRESVVNMVGESVLLDEPGEERKIKSNSETCLKKLDPPSTESEIQDKGRHNSVFIEEAGVDQSNQGRFAGAVSKRAKESTLCKCTKKEDSQVFSKVADAHPPKPPRSETQQLRDRPSFSLEHCDLITCPPVLGDEGNDEKIQIASLKRERELVCFSAVNSPPLVTHWLPDKDASEATQLSSAPDPTPASCDSNDGPMPKEKPKVKGPPPPVPKKPKNPFIKLKTAQLTSTGVQRRGKERLHSEEKAKRRHTFHFNKDPPGNTPINQDMCLLWDERGTYTVPTNRRPLSVDFSPLEHLLPGRMDDRCGDMIDFDYCVRMAKLSSEEELMNLDMLQRRVFLERRSRFKSSPPPVAKKPPNPFASTETRHIPEVIPDNETQRAKLACLGEREIHPQLQSKRVSKQDSNYNRGSSNRDYSDSTDAGSGSEVGSFKPVAELIKEKNQMQRHQGRVKPEGAKGQFRVADQSQSVNVSQMKNAFDAPKKSRETQREAQPSPKKGNG